MGTGNVTAVGASEATGFVALLPARDRDALKAIGTVRRFRKGAVIALEGDRSRHVLVLREGRVKISSATPDGRELLLAVRGPGELTGELAALAGDEGSRSATITTLDPVVAQVISTEDFLDYLERCPRALLVLTRRIILRLRDADRRRVEFGSYDTPGRVARLLVELAEEHGHPTKGGVEIGVALSQEELAGMVTASRESVARSLKSLRRRGLIATGRRSIVVCDLEALRQTNG
jgi:CRP/FNR family cyclic AMP-dependent transcriptional regulator